MVASNSERYIPTSLLDRDIDARSTVEFVDHRTRPAYKAAESSTAVTTFTY